MDATEQFFDEYASEMRSRVRANKFNRCAEHVDVAFTQQLVLPGDYVDNKIALKNSRVRIGEGSLLHFVQTGRVNFFS
jgi:hypothetical protein